MAWFAKIPSVRSGMTISSVLRTYECSIMFLRTLSSSSPKLIARFQNSPDSALSLLSGEYSFLLNRKLSRSLCTGIRQSNCIGNHILRGNQLRCYVRLFHTNGMNAARLGTDIQGSPNKNNSALIYVVALFILMLGGAYAGVPLYKVFCQASGLGGQAIKEKDSEKIETMKKVDREIKVRFNADVASSMRWNFKPQQTEVTVLPGETALAFYTAKNPTEKPIIGISTYNVLPFDAGQYFNKIQCFCFEEQRLNPNEQVDMPVFFFIDPEFVSDPKLEHVDTIHLSYTFFEAVDGLTLPLPGYPQPHDPVLPGTSTTVAAAAAATQTTTTTAAAAAAVAAS